MVDWALKINYLSDDSIRPDITVMVDWALKINYLSDDSRLLLLNRCPVAAVPMGRTDVPYASHPTYVKIA